MKIFHQHGHNYVWNIDSFIDDACGDGHIISPVNIQFKKIRDKIPEEIRQYSFFDPQFYLPNDAAKKLATYPFFPKNFLNEFSTQDFIERSHEIAHDCLIFQRDLGFCYSIIPTRYFRDLPDNYLEQLTTIFIEPFIEEHQAIADAPPLLMTVIAKPIHLQDGLLRTELLSWITNYPYIKGVYLIFDNNFYTKQIKDAEYLSDQLLFIHDLRQNEVEVHIGYTNTESYLFSVADPTSVSMGSYENLRSFQTGRLETRESNRRKGPRPRIYSGKLFQWIEDLAFPPLRALVPNWENLFDNSPYINYLLDYRTKLNFQRKEIYKHHFLVFTKQVASLPSNVQARPEFIRKKVLSAIRLFETIRDHGVFLDSDSDSSHLVAWMNALAIFESKIKK